MASEHELYILRIRLKWAKGVWREIAIRDDQSLHDLHRGILEAFEWDEDDTYRFHMSGDLEDCDEKKIYSPDSDGNNPRQTTLKKFRLRDGQRFFYVYGNGEKNQFPVKIVSIEEPESGVTYPDVVDENGESPDQELAYE